LANTLQDRIENLIGVVIPAVSDQAYTNAVTDGCQELMNLVPKDMLWGLGKSTTISNGTVMEASVIEGGDGYSADVTPVWSEPSLATGHKPIAAFTIEDDGGSGSTNTITGVLMQNGGSGYKDIKPILSTDEDDESEVNTDAVFSIKTYSGNAEVGTNTILHVERETESLTNCDPDAIDVNEGEDDRTSVVECREVPAALKGRVQPGSGWSEEVTENDPIFYKENGKIYILPVPYMNGTKVITAEVPTNLAFDSEKGIVPKEMEYLLVLYGATQILNIHITGLAFPDITDSGYTNETLTELLNGPDFSDVNTNFEVSISDYPALEDNDLILVNGAYVDFAGGSGEQDEITYDDPGDGIDLSTEFTALQGFIDDEDPDLAAIQSQKIQAILSEYQAKQNDAVQTMNAQVQGAQSRLQEAIQEVSIKQSAYEKEKGLQLSLVKGKLERRSAAINEVLQLHGSQVTKIQTLLQEYQANLNDYDAQKKSKQELQASLLNSYNGGVQALLSRYKGESKEIANPAVAQPQPQGVG